MRKTVAFLLSTVLLLSVSACTTEGAISETKASPTSVAQSNEITAPAEASQAGEAEEETSTESQILIAWFSRWGNTEYPEGIDASTSASIVIDNDTFGTTEYVARMIQSQVGGDLHLIQTQDPYPIDFDELRDQNHKEMDEGYLPLLVESSLDMTQYDTVFIGYPVWATDVPQAVLSFLNDYDLSGKTVIPFCTHDGYGAGSSYQTVSAASHAAESFDGLAIEAKDVPNAQSTIAEWLAEIGMSSTAEQQAGTAIQITIGDVALAGELYDTALANEIKAYFPLTVSMTGYGGREYYGGVDFYPENLEGGQRTFENGDITYCEAHHNMAIFYAQTDNPNLSVDVIPIGHITSNLSVFETLGGSETVTFSLAQ